MYLIIQLQGGTLRTHHPGAHVWRSVIGTCSLWLWYFAITELPLAMAMTFNYMSPIWMAFILLCVGWWTAKNNVETHVELPLLGAILFSFIGVTLVLRPAVEADQWLGAMVGLTSSVITAFAYLQVRKLGRMGEPEYRIVLFFSATTVVAGVAGALLTGASGGIAFHAHTPKGLALLLAIGLFALGGQFGMTRAYRVGKVLVVANLQYTGIIFSSVFGLLIWHDLFDWYVWAGMGLVLLSGVAATFYNTRNTAAGPAVSKTDPIASEL
jgi:S-adenosylmethionine uptake transporter